MEDVTELKAQIAALEARLGVLGEKITDDGIRLDALLETCAGQEDLITVLVDKQEKLLATIENFRADREALKQTIAVLVRDADIKSGRAWAVGPGSKVDHTR